MVNPFDRSFANFLIGFALILAIAFAIYYWVQGHGTYIDSAAATIIGG